MKPNAHGSSRCNAHHRSARAQAAREEEEEDGGAKGKGGVGDSWILKKALVFLMQGNALKKNQI